MTVFKPTAVQKKALALLSGDAKHILLFGGSRSGKTTVIVMAVIYRAIRYAGSRHLICRYRAKDARSSVLHETLIPWLNKTIGANRYRLNVHDGFMAYKVFIRKIEPRTDEPLKKPALYASAVLGLIKERREYEWQTMLDTKKCKIINYNYNYNYNYGKVKQRIAS